MRVEKASRCVGICLPVFSVYDECLSMYCLHTAIKVCVNGRSTVFTLKACGLSEAVKTCFEKVRD